jgi:hypothetical protein
MNFSVKKIILGAIWCLLFVAVLAYGWKVANIQPPNSVVDDSSAASIPPAKR